MGRTVRTAREAIQIEESKWKAFRRQLSVQEKERMDRIFDYARSLADAGTLA